MPETEKKNVYISLHRNFVRENIEYTDRATGETRTFNQARLPEGTVIDGRDMGGYEFSPLFVNESRFRGEEWRDIPLLADREVWLQRSVMDPEGNPVVGEDGRRMKDIVKVMPAQIKDALDLARREYLGNREQQPLDSRAQHVRGASAALSESDIPFDAQSR